MTNPNPPELMTPAATTAPPPRKRTRPQAVPETLPAEQEIAVLHCGDEILIEARLAPGMSYLCDRHGAQTAARFRSES